MTDRPAPESPRIDRAPSSPAQRMQPPRPRPQPSTQSLDRPLSAPRSQRSGSATSQSSSHPLSQSHQPSQAPSRQPSQQQALHSPAQQPSQRQSASPTPDSNQQFRPPLEPLFALVQNSTTQTTHHPRLHYIFSDDDENEALAQALNHSAHRHHHAQRPFDRSSQESAEGSRDSLAQGYRDRAVLLELDVGEDGKWKVAQANSLSSDWAVVRAEVAQMEDSDGGRARGNQEEDAEEGKFMLMVEGVEGAGNASLTDGSMALDGSRGSGRSEVTQGDYGTLVDEFEKRMRVLRRVVDGSEERKIEEGVERTELGVLEEESAEGEK